MKAGMIGLIFCKALLCATLLNNPFRISEAVFDQANLAFKISWCIDSAALENGISGGITVSYHQSVRPETYFLPTKLCGDTVLHIYDLKFDTTYHLQIWAKHQENLLQPESLSSRVVSVYSLIKQPVSFFHPAKSTDTVKALNGKVILWKEKDYLQGVPPHEDTVYYYRPDASKMKGFVQVGTGIRFANPEPSLPFFIALSIDSIPAYSKAERVLIYRDSLGFFIPERNCQPDISGKFVMMKTDRIKFPLIVMVDTVAPTHRLVSKVLPVIDSTQINDTVEISDNSANVSWSFYCMPGAELPSKPVRSGIIQGTTSKIPCRISSSGAHANGIRALLIFSDGSFSDTINLSKSGIRSNSDPFTTESKMIMPLLTTAILDNPGASVCLGSLFGKHKSYDKSEFRIFRWASEPGQTTDNWVEYEPKYESLFQIKPGALFWIICDKSQIIDLGRGTTVPLDKPCELVLPPKNWTDFANPYGFDIGLSDAFSSSSPDARSVHIYSWKAQVAQKTYSASLMYSAAISDKAQDTIKAQRNGYTVYNPFDTAIILRFPPYPYGFFSNNLSKTREDGFSVKVALRSGNDTLGSVYCCGHTFSQDTIVCPPPPSFGNAGISIENGNRLFGIISYPLFNSTVSAYEINVGSDEGDRPISLSAGFTDNHNSGRKMKIICDNQAVISASNAQIDVLKSRKITIYIGKSSDIDNLKNLASIAPAVKPSIGHFYKNKKLNLKMNNVYQCQCVMELYDLQGKLILRKRWSPDRNHENYSIPVSVSGTYLLRISFISDKFNNHSIIQHVSCM